MAKEKDGGTALVTGYDLNLIKRLIQHLDEHAGNTAGTDTFGRAVVMLFPKMAEKMGFADSTFTPDVEGVPEGSSTQRAVAERMSLGEPLAPGEADELADWALSGK